ncbi:MAG: ATP-binding protein [Planctomycetes bacterium]|nr:ATP-binding protein [Planctomycetota bacterium]
MHAHVELLLRGQLDHLRVVWQTGEALLENVPFRQNPQQTSYNVLVAVQEMLTNVFRHGLGGATDEPVRVVFEVSDDAFEVEIRDRGPYFDPRDHEAELIDSDEMPETPGGWGITIVRWVMDEIDYTREGDWNVLRMAKLVAEPALELGGDDADRSEA